MNEDQQNKKKKAGIILWFVIGILLVTNGFTIWLLLNKKTEIVEQKPQAAIRKISQGPVQRIDLTFLRFVFRSLGKPDKFP